MANFNDLIYGARSTLIAVGTGVSQIQFFPFEARRICSEVKYRSGGGTLFFIGSSNYMISGSAGMTLSANIQTTESLNIGGPSSFYLGALGATCLVEIVMGYSQGA